MPSHQGRAAIHRPEFSLRSIECVLMHNNTIFLQYQVTKYQVKKWHKVTQIYGTHQRRPPVNRPYGSRDGYKVSQNRGQGRPAGRSDPQTQNFPLSQYELNWRSLVLFADAQLHTCTGVLASLCRLRRHFTAAFLAIIQAHVFSVQPHVIEY